MKKIIYTFLIALFCISTSTKATTYVVQVEDFEFSPSVLTVNVGDTITWIWDEGVHTTTSLNIPTGATGWDQQIDQNNLIYSYVVSLPGSYDYVCSYHVSMGMVGHFTAVGATGIATLNAFAPVVVMNVITDNVLTVKFTSADKWKITLLNAAGQMANEYAVVSKAGSSETFPLSDLANGIYFVQFANDRGQQTERIVKQ